ncbi:MAG: hypothetical protein GY864_10235 [Desulfobacterales bacterium]|nr:hypothetical protein [Desulfobacterales bacterium]
MDKTINAEDLKNYFSFSNKIAKLEDTLYESGDKLDREESKITELVAQQNKIRFDEDGVDLFQDRIETIINILADNFKVFGFEYGLYFDLVYNLAISEYARFEKIHKEERIAKMLYEIDINDTLIQKIKALLEHEEEVGKLSKKEFL